MYNWLLMYYVQYNNVNPKIKSEEIKKDTIIYKP